MAVTLLSIQIGRITQSGRADAVDPLDVPWTTAFFKSVVSGPVKVDDNGVAGDAQADRENHGGPDKAVLCYSADHFPAWAAELGEPVIPLGGFGENLTVAGLDETGVCVGDHWRFGDVVLEVSQPRQPCWKLGRRWRRPELVQRVVQTGRTGWYCRVLEEGVLQAPAPGVLLARPLPKWSIQRANQVFYHRRQDPAATRELALLPQLAMAWREVLWRES